jgi:hypothetical protein
MSAYQDHIVLRPLLLVVPLHREAVIGLEARARAQRKSLAGLTKGFCRVKASCLNWDIKA